MGKTLTTGVCLLALAAVTDANAARHRPVNCADAAEVSALQTAAVQQELMDAALGCGQPALEKFNAFQTSYNAELRRSDKTLLTLFKRVYGGVRGDAAYNLFKTDMASKAEIKRVHGVGDFCTAADLVFAAALAPIKPALDQFVSGVAVADAENSPIGSCNVQVALTLQGAQAGPMIVPKPNPLRVAVVTPQELPTPASLTVSNPPPPGSVAAAAARSEPVPQPMKQEADPSKPKKSGWLSGLFH